jgi:hypothetical protein
VAKSIVVDTAGDVFISVGLTSIEDGVEVETLKLKLETELFDSSGP